MNLITAMKKLHADNFTFYLKSHKYHWNIEGPNFREYHKFLNKIYVESWEDVDSIAEQIRALDTYANGSLESFKDLTTITEDDKVPSALEMLKILYDDLDIVLNSIKDAYKEAEKYKELGLSNFLQDMYDRRKKTCWMLRSTLKHQDK